MCGIAGMQLRAGVVDPARLEPLRHVQAHRGPDAFAIHASGALGVAHHQLRIRDLSAAADQPIANARHVLVYNGEIYNCAELAAKLGDPSLASRADSAVLFAHLCRFGVESTLQVLRGMFAFAFADLVEGTVHLCRDRLGIKPLVYASDARGVYWASEVKALRCLTRIQVNPTTSLFATKLGDHVRAPFAGVRQVEPGTFAVLRGGDVVAITRYHDLAEELDASYRTSLDGLDDTAVVVHFDELVRASVKRMRASAAPLAAFVSGGVDSSLLAAIATGLPLFSADVVGETSESQHVRALGELLGTVVEEARLIPDMLLTDWVESTWHYEHPIIYHPNAFALAAVARRARDAGMKSALTGEGADELFIGYPSSVGPAGTPASPARLDLLDALAIESRAHHADALDELSPDERPHVKRTLDLLRGHLRTLLHRNDRVGMRFAVETRFPFLDEAIVRFGLNLPIRRKLARTTEVFDERHPFVIDKWIVRATAARYLPRAITERPKWGFRVDGRSMLRVAPAFFDRGFVATALDLTRSQLVAALRGRPPLELVELAAVEIFGRLFALDHDPAAITDALGRHSAFAME